MIVLFDSSVLIALADDTHIAHAQSNEAINRFQPEVKIATCAITQLALLRYLMQFRRDLGIGNALELLRQFTDHNRHVFLSQDIQPVQGRWFGVIGHTQVTDAYLADIARAHGAKLLTADRGLAALHVDVAELI